MVWIEIKAFHRKKYGLRVTTLVVVWIEIRIFVDNIIIGDVTTLVVVWIEIGSNARNWFNPFRHHSRSGVDWNCLMQIYLI